MVDPIGVFRTAVLSNFPQAVEVGGKIDLDGNPATTGDQFILADGLDAGEIALLGLKQPIIKYWDINGNGTVGTWEIERKYYTLRALGHSDKKVSDYITGTFEKDSIDEKVVDEAVAAARAALGVADRRPVNARSLLNAITGEFQPAAEAVVKNLSEKDILGETETLDDAQLRGFLEAIYRSMRGFEIINEGRPTAHNEICNRFVDGQLWKVLTISREDANRAKYAELRKKAVERANETPVDGSEWQNYQHTVGTMQRWLTGVSGSDKDLILKNLESSYAGLEENLHYYPEVLRIMFEGYFRAGKYEEALDFIYKLGEVGNEVVRLLNACLFSQNIANREIARRAFKLLPDEYKDWSELRLEYLYEFKARVKFELSIPDPVVAEKLKVFTYMCSYGRLNWRWQLETYVAHERISEAIQNVENYIQTVSNPTDEQLAGAYHVLGELYQAKAMKTGESIQKHGLFWLSARYFNLSYTIIRRKGDGDEKFVADYGARTASKIGNIILKFFLQGVRYPASSDIGREYRRFAKLILREVHPATATDITVSGIEDKDRGPFLTGNDLSRLCALGEINSYIDLASPDRRGKKLLPDDGRILFEYRFMNGQDSLVRKYPASTTGAKVGVNK